MKIIFFQVALPPLPRDHERITEAVLDVTIAGRGTGLGVAKSLLSPTAVHWAGDSKFRGIEGDLVFARYWYLDADRRRSAVPSVLAFTLHVEPFLPPSPGALGARVSEVVEYEGAPEHFDNVAVELRRDVIAWVAATESHTACHCPHCRRLGEWFAQFQRPLAEGGHG